MRAWEKEEKGKKNDYVISNLYRGKKGKKEKHLSKKKFLKKGGKKPVSCLFLWPRKKGKEKEEGNLSFAFLGTGGQKKEKKKVSRD